jgi:zinc transport system substrate-binding protein
MLAIGCRPASHARLSVAVSVFPLYDLVRRIAGPDADVTVVLPPGRSLEGWAPPADASSRLASAGLLVSVGLGLDPWMDALSSSASPKAKVLRLGDRVPTIASEDGKVNGYVWMDPQRARLMATAIAEDLARADSSHAIAFRDRASVLDAALASLDKEIESSTTTWAKHDGVALPATVAYYAERYGLQAAHPSAGVGAALVAEVTVDPLGGTGPSVSSYEELIRFDTRALEPIFR